MGDHAPLALPPAVPADILAHDVALMPTDPAGHLMPGNVVAVRGGGGKTAAMMVGGVALLGLALVSFALGLIGNPPFFAFIAGTVIPTMCGLGLLASGYRRALAPDRVIVSPEGLLIHAGGSIRRLAWNELSYCERESANLFQPDALKVYDRRGRTAVKIPASLEPFDALVEAVRLNLRRDERPEQRREVDQLQRLKKTRSGLLSLVIGVLFLALCISLLVHELDERRDQARLEREGVEGTAEIVERRIAPNGITRRLVYRVTTPAGSAEHNVEVPRDYWDSLGGETQVPVRYLVDDPSVARTPNEVPDELAGGAGGLIVPILGIPMALFFIGAGAFLLLGFDLRKDEITGQTRLRRMQ